MIIDFTRAAWGYHSSLRKGDDHVIELAVGTDTEGGEKVWKFERGALHANVYYEPNTFMIARDVKGDSIHPDAALRVLLSAVSDHAMALADVLKDAETVHVRTGMDGQGHIVRPAYRCRHRRELILSHLDKLLSATEETDDFYFDLVAGQLNTVTDGGTIRVHINA
jgi:hypothetical protein